MKAKLDSKHIQEMVMADANGKWTVLSKELLGASGQLIEMDGYQERLSSLLKKNDAAALSGTEDVLCQVEQYICRNMRKVLNYMEIADPCKESDIRTVENELKSISADTAKKLEQVDIFLFSVAKFLNSQGEDGNTGPEMLESYQKAILQSLEEF